MESSRLHVPNFACGRFPLFYENQSGLESFLHKFNPCFELQMFNSCSSIRVPLKILTTSVSVDICAMQTEGNVILKNGV